MAAALTIVVLLALSFVMVRIAAVAMRLTGLPENVARFQCISALTGTGFTTHESEMIVNYPIRRRILVALMVLGNLGLVSVAATFIVTFVETGSNSGAVLAQILAIAGAIGVTLLLMANKTLDRAMCSLVAVLLSKFTDLGRRRYQRILQLDDGFSIAEHVYAGKKEQQIEGLPSSDIPLTLLAIRGGKTREFRQASENAQLSPGDVFICYGSEIAHEAFEDMMVQLESTAFAVSET